MRCVSILSLVFAIAVPLLAQGQYFPKLSFGSSSTLDELKQTWYSSQLRALQEPSLLTLVKSPSSECYRFLWLRTFNHPIAIRLEPMSDGTSVLTTKVASGDGGFHPGVLSETTSPPAD